MVLRDRNRPSVIMWSITKDIPTRDTPAIVALSKTDYADSFFVTLDVAGYTGINEPEPALAPRSWSWARFSGLEALFLPLAEASAKQLEHCAGEELRRLQLQRRHTCCFHEDALCLDVVLCVCVCV
jgi:hypothetical protein